MGKPLYGNWAPLDNSPIYFQSKQSYFAACEQTLSKQLLQ